MELEAGSKLGPYEISGKIGAGGMGTVYLARDTRLGRDVAIKTSAEQFSERFEREARTVAGLNHPNICTLHDVGPNYLVMELVEGPTLAERIAEGAMPVNEALNVARQIASALSAAHEQGVVHRDLKPGNIKIKSDGVVRVLDFGLAKTGGAVAATSDNSPTLNMTATQAGMILGTAAYMSPEQARGKSVDKRADIWAFGVVLFEMVTGRPLFKGGDLTETLASVIKEDPDWNTAPAEVRRLLRKCLEKDPKKRLQDIGDMELLLEGAGPVPPPTRNVLPWIVAGIVAVALAISLLGWRWAAQPKEAQAKQLLRLDMDLGPDVKLGSPLGADVIISPDGNRLAYVSQSHLYTRRLDQAKDVQLAGTDGAFSPFFSPNGEWIAFFTGNKLMKVAVAGGTPIYLCDAPNGRGGSWGADGIIAALSSANISITRIPDGGGKPETVIELDRAHGEITQRWPQILPGGKAILLTSHTVIAGFDDANIDVYSIKDRRRTTLVNGGTYGRYIGGPDGHGYLIYLNRGSLFAVAMDLDSLEVKGTPLPVLDDVGYNLASGSAQMDFSANGTLVYRDSASGGGLVNLQWLEPGGKTKPMLQKAGPYLFPSISPDGNLVALGANSGISVYDTRRESPLQSLTGAAGSTYPLWSPNGLFIMFQSTVGISWTRADGASKPMTAVQSKNPQYPWSFTDDGKTFSFMEVNPETGYDLWTASVESDAAGIRIGKPESFLKTPADERHPSLSPDGHWLAYTSNDSGSYQVYVKAFPDKGGRFPVSSGVGMYPVWSHTSHEIFYRSEDNKIMVGSYSVIGDSFAADKPRVWFEKPLANLGLYRSFDVSRDGKRIAALMPLEDQAAQTKLNHVFFLQNFFDDVRRRLTSAR